MTRHLLVFLFLLNAVTNVSARLHIPDADTSVPGKGYLFVLNGQISGRIEQKDLKQIDSLKAFFNIKMVNVLNDSAAVLKYGEAGHQGAIEITTGDNKSDTRSAVIQPVPVDTSRVVENPEIPASFPGGDAKWRYYLERNLDASIPVNMKAPAGTYTVRVKFKVDLDGKISDFSVLTNHGYGMEQEVIRVIKKGPAWNAAINNGKMVNSWRVQPVTFHVMAPDPSKKSNN